MHILAEAQSGPDADMVLRALGVQVRRWERQRRLGLALTAVIPLVISHGADWRAVHALLRANPDPSMEIQFIQRGMLKGRCEGIHEGLLNGQREVLARQLTLKFGVLPGSSAERIARATPDELVEYSLRVLSAETLEAVFDMSSARDSDTRRWTKPLVPVSARDGASAGSQAPRSPARGGHRCVRCHPHQQLPRCMRRRRSGRLVGAWFPSRPR